MLHKSDKHQEGSSILIDEPVIDCGRKDTETLSSNTWNPNVPFVGTQEEWWQHFHQIEQGTFMTLEELDNKMKIWWEKRCFADKL